MSKIVQYSPELEIMSYFQKYGFIYHPEDGGVGITSMNRLRKFTESLGVIGASRNLIIAILMHSGGSVLGYAMNTYGHNSLICTVNIQKYKETVFWALISGKIEGHVTQLGISPDFDTQLHPVMKLNKPSPRSFSGRVMHTSQPELTFAE